ncbi:MAG: hypothetical protein HYS22_08470 [Deltaproteobacteria bacterium]|nr:hypothetical protein [Deltaproteobacteria bacterium]
MKTIKVVYEAPDGTSAEMDGGIDFDDQGNLGIDTLDEARQVYAGMIGFLDNYDTDPAIPGIQPIPDPRSRDILSKVNLFLDGSPIATGWELKETFDRVSAAEKARAKASTGGARASGRGTPSSGIESEIYDVSSGSYEKVEGIAGLKGLKFDDKEDLSKKEADDALRQLNEAADKLASKYPDKKRNEILRNLIVTSDKNPRHQYRGPKIVEIATGKPLDPTVAVKTAAGKDLSKKDVAINTDSTLTPAEAVALNDGVIKDALVKAREKVGGVATFPEFDGMEDEDILEQIVVVVSDTYRPSAYEVRQEAGLIPKTPRLSAVYQMDGGSTPPIVKDHVDVNLDSTLTEPEAVSLYNKLILPAMTQLRTRPGSGVSDIKDDDLLKKIWVTVGATHYNGFDIRKTAGLAPSETTDATGSGSGTGTSGSTDPLLGREPDFGGFRPYDGIGAGGSYYGDEPIRGYGDGYRGFMQNGTYDVALGTELVNSVTNLMGSVGYFASFFGFNLFGGGYLYGFGDALDLNADRVSRRAIAMLIALLNQMARDSGDETTVDRMLAINNRGHAATMIAGEKALNRGRAAAQDKSRAVARAMGRIDLSKQENQARYRELESVQTLLNGNLQALASAVNLYQGEVRDAREDQRQLADRRARRASYYMFTS